MEGIDEGDGLEALFPRLRTLDLARNEIDSLESIEKAVNARVRRPIEWKGLPKPIANLVKAATTASLKLPATKDDGVPPPLAIEVSVAENALGLEQARRRAFFPPSSTPSTVSPTNSNDHVPLSASKSGKQKAVEKEAWEIEMESGLATEGARRRARIEAARRASEMEEAPQVVLSMSATEVEAISGDLGELKLNEEESGVPGTEEVFTPPPPVVSVPLSPSTPLPSSPAPLSSSSSVPHEATVEPSADPADPNDPAVLLIASSFHSLSGALSLSRRSLASLPTPSQGTAPFLPASRVDLSYNTLDMLPLAALVTWNWTSSLRSLNLSQNQLVTLDLLSGPLPVFAHLSDLNLSSNRLQSQISSSASLLSLLATIAPNLETLDLSWNGLTTTQGIVDLLIPAAGLGLRRLNLKGNKINDLEGLCETAKRENKRTWRCEEVDLSDNEIARVRHFPVSFLDSKR